MSEQAEVYEAGNAFVPWEVVRKARTSAEAQKLAMQWAKKTGVPKGVGLILPDQFVVPATASSNTPQG